MKFNQILTVGSHPHPVEDLLLGLPAWCLEFGVCKGKNGNFFPSTWKEIRQSLAWGYFLFVNFKNLSPAPSVFPTPSPI